MAHNLVAYSQSEQGFSTHFNMYPEVQLPSPNGSLGHTRGQVNCAMARSKALINAGMPVYFVWNRKSHIANGTAKSVGSHSVSQLCFAADDTLVEHCGALTAQRRFEHSINETLIPFLLGACSKIGRNSATCVRLGR